MFTNLVLSPLTWQGEKGLLSFFCPWLGGPYTHTQCPVKAISSCSLLLWECLWGPLVSSLILGGLPWYPVCYLFPDCILCPALSLLHSVGRSASLLNSLLQKMFNLAPLDTGIQQVTPRPRSHYPAWAKSPQAHSPLRKHWAQMCLTCFHPPALCLREYSFLHSCLAYLYQIQ